MTDSQATDKSRQESVQFECANCGSKTTLHGYSTAPADALCPPCHFFGPDWEEDPFLVAMVDGMQNRNRQ